MAGDMDLDLADYDQVDEAKFFMSQRLGLDGQAPGAAANLIVTLSSSCELAGNSTTAAAATANAEAANCENDFVFLPPAPLASEQQAASASREQQQQQQQRQQAPKSIDGPAETGRLQPTSLPLVSRHDDELQRRPTGGGGGQLATAGRAAHPLMAINANAGAGAVVGTSGAVTAAAGKNPFYNLHQISPDSASSQAYQPFWMRPESFASKPIGVLEQFGTSTASNSGTTTTTTSTAATATGSAHLSDLMHQIVTKADSIYIAIPCAYCHERKACPPSDISAWLNHMNRAHNCKVCPICNKLVGLGPMRDLEIMRKHVVAHIDDDWLERRIAKTTFSFGAQQQWFSDAKCQVRQPPR